MSTDTLLSRLENVRQTGAGRWIARCPAHDDRRPSLAIRELEDGRLLLHDFSGCTVNEIVSAVGLTLSDLFPERPLDHHQSKERRPFNAADVLECVAFEALIASVAAGNMAEGWPLSDVDRQRLLIASQRLQRAVEAIRA